MSRGGWNQQNDWGQNGDWNQNFNSPGLAPSQNNNPGIFYPGTNPNPGPQPTIPAFGGSDFLSKAVAGYAYQAGGQFISNTQKSGYVFNSTVRPFFNVSNAYIRRKLAYLTTPFLKFPEEDYHVTTEVTDIVQQDQQHKNISTPDLYIPLMSLITYILLLCLVRGSEKSEFDPKQIGVYATNCFVEIMLELGLVKLLLILINVRTLTVLDLLAYNNYKFFGLCVSLLVGWLLPGFPSFFVKLYFSLASVIFMFKTLKSYAQNVAITNMGLGNFKKDTMLIMLSGLQFITFWIIMLLSI